MGYLVSNFAEHQALNLALNLITAQSDKAYAEQLAIDFFKQFAEHCKSEEWDMHELNYPNIAEHKLEHINLTFKFIEIIKAFKNNSFFLTTDFVDGISDILARHNKNHDAKFVTWLNTTRIVYE